MHLDRRIPNERVGSPGNSFQNHLRCQLDELKNRKQIWVPTNFSSSSILRFQWLPLDSWEFLFLLPSSPAFLSWPFTPPKVAFPVTGMHFARENGGNIGGSGSGRIARVGCPSYWPKKIFFVFFLLVGTRHSSFVWEIFSYIWLIEIAVGNILKLVLFFFVSADSFRKKRSPQVAGGNWCWVLSMNSRSVGTCNPHGVFFESLVAGIPSKNAQTWSNTWSLRFVRI